MKYHSKETAEWNDEKWNAFIKDALYCGVSGWAGSYNNPFIQDWTYWDLKMSGDSGSFENQGHNAYPADWDKFLGVLSDYFGITVQ